MSQTPRTKRLSARQKSQGLILGGLLLLLAVLGVRQFLFSGPGQAAGQSSASVEEPPGAGPDAGKPMTRPRTIRVAVPAQSGGNLFAVASLRDGGKREQPAEAEPSDPKQPPREASSNEAPTPAEPAPAELRRRGRNALTLQATMADTRPRAIINGQMYEVGDKVAGWRLKRVAAQHVVMTRGEVSLQLVLNRF